MNAFALPGGYVYLTRGILAHLNSEAELAGVLGHEIAHVTARHSAAQYSKQTAGSLGLLLSQIFVPELRPFGQAAEQGLGLLFLKFGRDDEMQADDLGAGYATAQGWDPQGVSSMLETLGRLSEGTDRKGVPNWLSTHPMPADRVARLEQRVAALRSQATRELSVNRAAYLQHVDGLMFGDNPREGVLRGNAFLHPDMKFRLEFPQGWQVQNTPQQVVAQPQGGGAYVFLQLVLATARGVRCATLPRRTSDNPGCSLSKAATRASMACRRLSAPSAGRLQNMGDVVFRSAWISHNNQVFRLAGLSSASAYRQLQQTVDASVRSFQPLSAGEAERIRPNVIELYTAKSGDTWQSLASGPGRKRRASPRRSR